MSQSIKILWVDDEIEHLKAPIRFLEDKGYLVVQCSNGQDAIELVDTESPDVVFLDESMPGLTGLETLSIIKEKQPRLPVVMITKNEEEDLMEEAIGSKITDYLIKPVNPTQVLLTLKKIIDQKRIVKEHTNSAYQQEFQRIFSLLQEAQDHREWAETYKKLIYWELELEKSAGNEMQEILAMQKTEANGAFSKFIIKHYLDWINGKDDDTPLFSHELLKEKVFPHVNQGKPVFVILIDNLRFDQYKTIEPLIAEKFKLEEEDHFYSILPTTTQYSRNSIFAGMMPYDIQKRMPDFWFNDDEEGGKNMHEHDFLNDNLSRNKIDIKSDYLKITNHRNAAKLEDNILNYLNNDLTVIVYNFVDMLSHARTEMEVLKELASDEPAYRSITHSWFTHSPLWTALQRLEGKGATIIFTTDHGTMQVGRPSKVVGDRNTSTNLRYKTGRNLNYNQSDVLEIRDPHQALLPKSNLSSSYIFAKEDLFFVYPNNYNHFVNYYKNTFQHGGISLEEMIVPIARYSS